MHGQINQSLKQKTSFQYSLPADSLWIKPHAQTHLVYAVQELQEDGGEAAALAAQRLCPTVAESVAERQPLLLHQQPEAVKGSVVWIREQLHQ